MDGLPVQTHRKIGVGEFNKSIFERLNRFHPDTGNLDTLVDPVRRVREIHVESRIQRLSVFKENKPIVRLLEIFQYSYPNETTDLVLRIIHIEVDALIPQRVIVGGIISLRVLKH
jgi:hypothetical protein